MRYEKFNIEVPTSHFDCIIEAVFSMRQILFKLWLQLETFTDIFHVLEV